MATGDYCTLDELKRDLWPDDMVPSGVNDDKLKSVVTAVSREIDMFTGTRFYDTGSDETRYYTARDPNYCYIDPATTVTSVATDDELDRTYSTSWTADTHFETWPYNTQPYRGLPIVRINRVPLGDYTFPRSARGVKVVARYCYNAGASPTATVADIKQVCLLKCVRLFKRKDAPFGVLGPTELGQVSVIPGFDPDEMRILSNYSLEYT